MRDAENGFAGFKLQMHPIYLQEQCLPIACLALSPDIPHCHHENGDATGYQNGLIKDVSPLFCLSFIIGDSWVTHLF